ncbi:hypothetical protein PVK06_021277 [Gossypium arboreum]|uniref:Uncharacterized protein n=1 Tax=Gossypium arboreum TaxID=29729 RepID=A0ABR0PQ34_GOSAR|nr:hypothetical protein PVK06_021277 [Gossypium arboreum]
MDRALDLQPSLKYIRWYCEIGKPFLFGGRSMALQATDIIQSLISSAHYHISTPVILARIHLSTPLLPARIHRRTLLLPVRINRRTPFLPAQVHRWRLRHDFSSMFHTPLHTDEKNVDRRNRPQRECRAPQKYIPRTTPSNHQF